ncbi:type II toxin-antitoxin system VapC family toxin [Deinococcus koreensis]|uniref:type II toxin-antitoxin system VapC family toxin n=1 Tax=Deinococcus koreensis TaxID=2054903 RepID=UPI0024353BEC|nr:type II toxin-antitoxin system VapC family toxin [Deinococcus koreensis]
MLDTNICVYVLNHRPAAVREKFVQYQLGELAVSSVTVAELAYGAAQSTRSGTRERLETFLLELPFDEAAAWRYGTLRAHPHRLGQPVGPLDLQIAAHALSVGVTLVTNNEGKFRRVEGLTVENWFSG